MTIGDFGGIIEGWKLVRDLLVLAQHGNDRGFVDELVELLVNQPYRLPENDVGEFQRDAGTPFDLTAFINTPGRETRESEEQIEGDFTTRLPRPNNVFSLAQHFANEETTNIGNDIVLSSILEQLNLPSASAGFSDGESNFAEIDIIEFVDPGMGISKTDIQVGNLRKKHNDSGLLGRGI